MSLISIFILLAAHCIGDYPLQGEFLATHKGENNFILLVHCIIYTACVLVGLVLALPLISAPINETILLTIIAVILVSHFIIDKRKCEFMKKLDIDYTKNMEQKKELMVCSFYEDQMYHIVIICTIMILIVCYNYFVSIA